MSGVSSDVITQELSIYKEARPVTQKKTLTAREEVEKLLSTGFI